MDVYKIIVYVGIYGYMFLYIYKDVYVQKYKYACIWMSMCARGSRYI